MPISYDPNTNPTAGFLQIATGTPAASKTDQNTLLHLLFWLTYTQEGRSFLADNRLGTGKSEQQIFANFAAMLPEKFGLTDDGLHNAIASAHLAADRYVLAKKNISQAEMETQDKIYQQNMSFIMWTLWENSMAHEFSMNW